MNARTKQQLFLAATAGGVLLAARAAARAWSAYDLRGRTVLVTGGSRGLGLVLARELAREGARLAICARDEAELERARAELAAWGTELLAVPCDVTNPDDVQTMVDAVRRRFGRVDVLINNAGIIQVGPIEEMTLDDYERAMRTHFWAPLYTTLAVLPEMRERREGRIVNVSSIGGKISIPHMLPYSASKFALTGLSEGLRSGLAQYGIAVTTVCPGLLRTGSPRNATFKGRHEEEYAWFSVADALPGITASAERMARRIVDACKHGDAEVVLPAVAAVQIKLHALMPGVGADVLGLLERLLPGPGGIGDQARTGTESRSERTPAWLTVLGDRAAVRNNEIA